MITNLSIGHCGRLGNQIFQYAILKCISLKHGYEIVLPKENIENITTGRFNPDINDVDRYKLDLYDCFDIHENIDTIANIKANIEFEYSENFTMDYNHKLIDLAKNNTNYHGFFQCVDYYLSFENELKQILKFKNHINVCVKKYLNDIKNKFNVDNLVTIHIRRGDVASDNGKYQVLLSSDYYQNIINLIDDSNTIFLIVSDDIKWCKNNFFGNNILFCDIYESNKNIAPHILDFCILSNGDKLVMSASSFSWWAAFLSNAKEIYCPNRWFGSEYKNFNESNIRHHKWIQVQYKGMP